MRFIKLIPLLLAGFAWAGPMFPYQGRLDLSGHPVTGQYDFQFSVFNAPSGGTPAWTPEVFTSVAVVGGAFSVKLGSVTAIDPAALVAGPLYVEVAVRPNATAAFTTLVGRQQLLHTPLSSASQKDFIVAGKLGVGGANPGDAGVSIAAIGPPSNGSTVGVLSLSSNGATLVADGRGVDSSGTLQLQGRTAQPTSVGGALQVTGNAQVTGQVTANSFAPQLTTGWQYITCSSGEVAFPHNFGTYPSHYVLQVCGALDATSTNCTTRILEMSGPGGYYDGTYVNPTTITLDTTNLYAGVFNCRWIWNYYMPNPAGGGSWGPGQFTGYYRVLFWR